MNRRPFVLRLMGRMPCGHEFTIEVPRWPIEGRLLGIGSFRGDAAKCCGRWFVHVHGGPGYRPTWRRVGSHFNRLIEVQVQTFEARGAALTFPPVSVEA